MYAYGIEPKRLSKIKPETMKMDACLRFMAPFSPMFARKKPVKDNPTTAKRMPTVLADSPSAAPKKAGTTRSTPEN